MLYHTNGNKHLYFMSISSQLTLDREQPLTVTEVNQIMNQTLEDAIGVVQFEGEISQLTLAGSGHIYFSVKDENSQVSAAMWRGMAHRLKFKPKVGDQVVCTGKPNVYHKTGRLQLIVNEMQPAGEGALRQKFLELKAKLEREGLFNPDRKRELPFLPKAVGVVTSGTGAVIHDIMVKIKERFPHMKIYLADVRVQGDGAAEEIARGIELFNSKDIVDVLIVGRGGGSLEDLWAFNEEVVVRAVFGSRIPVVSGVGHEVDIALSDLAADVRAPTPTAAAEMVVPKLADLLAQIEELEESLLDYDSWLQPLGQDVDELFERFNKAIGVTVEKGQLKVESAAAKLKALRPDKLIELFSAKIDGLVGELDAATKRAITRKTQRVDLLHARLKTLSPLAVLERGYSIVQSNGKAVKDADTVEKESLLDIKLAKGQLEAVVTGKN